MACRNDRLPDIVPDSELRDIKRLHGPQENSPNRVGCAVCSVDPNKQRNRPDETNATYPDMPVQPQVGDAHLDYLTPGRPIQPDQMWLSCTE